MFTKPLWNVINSVPVTRAQQFENGLFNNCFITCIFLIICKKEIFFSKFENTKRTKVWETRQNAIFKMEYPLQI